MKLKRVYCKYFPFSGYLALAWWPLVFIREDIRQRYTPTANRHEVTHGLQQIETLWILFLILYGIEYLVKSLCTLSWNKGYRSVSFEQEAYDNQDKVDYNNTRKHYAWIKYVFSIKK